MSFSLSRLAPILMGWCVLLGGPALHASPDKIPPDQVVHPLYTSVSPAQLLPDGRKDPVYPAKWRTLRLGAKVILQGEVEKSGRVTRIDVLMTKLRIEGDCEGAPGIGTEAKPTGPSEMNPEGGATKDADGQVAPPEAAKDFEAAAVAAVKQWKFRPGTQNGLPVAVYQTFIIEFTPCPSGTGKQNTPPSPAH